MTLSTVPTQFLISTLLRLPPLVSGPGNSFVFDLTSLFIPRRPFAKPVSRLYVLLKDFFNQSLGRDEPNDTIQAPRFELACR
ncbi:uncharacterized protein L3040_007227 [Drepanopeziza brunnea f. sp. 'multigermtubi']|uniref:uncharacterized protein n=1 Tax=Drepanopeziza brunnea f. sp. 'multigermtubi' TaxID=698441 RepID=UPI0023A53F3D|nr:hypothetical protein L3040_007227 [Drepanopeziza brunnea f. sp. 'multigermtubi']